MTDPGQLTLDYLATRPGDAARVLEGLDPAVVGAFLESVPVRVGAGPLASMVPWRAGRCLAAMDPARAAALVEAVPAERGPYALRAMSEAAREAVLRALPERRARTLRRQFRYGLALVGAHMNTDPLALRPEVSAAEARDALRDAGHGGLVQIHVIDGDGHPLGAVAVVDLLDAAPERPLTTLMQRACPAVAADLPLAQVDLVHGWTDWPEHPVIDGRQCLVGAVSLARVIAARSEPAAPVTASPGPASVLLQAYAATTAGLARALAGIFAAGGGDGRGR